MRTKIITMWFNEEFLAPYFLKHYSYIDNIHVIVDSDTNDNTRQIIQSFDNTTMEEFRFPDMMDEFLKVGKINEELHASHSYDWVIVVDSDEILFEAENPSFLEWLPMVPDNNNVVIASMWQVYRHHSENDLDHSTLPIHLQRRHGDPDLTSPFNALYNKPIVIRGSAAKDTVLDVGNHFITSGNESIYPARRVMGAHWAMADVKFAVERRIEGRKNRQSKVNLENSMTFQHHHITEEQIRNECHKHADDPRLF